MRYLAVPALVCALFGCPIAARAAATLAEVVAGTFGDRMVVGASIMRSAPNASGITPARIADQYSVKAVVTPQDPALIKELLKVMSQTMVTRGCQDYPFTQKNFPAGWAIVLYDGDGKQVGSVYLSQDGSCGLVKDDEFAVNGGFVAYLRARFGFMNFESQGP